MKKVSLFAVIVVLLGLGFVNNVSANSSSPLGNENTISVQNNFDGGITDPDDEDKDERDEEKR